MRDDHDDRPDDVHEGMHLNCALRRVHSPHPLDDWPGDDGGWREWDVVKRAHWQGADAALAGCGEYRGPQDGQGVVIAAGGGYLPGCYVTLRLLRDHLRSTLPVQVWHVGGLEMPASWHDLLTGIPGVDVVDAVDVARESHARMLQRYALKLYALHHCPWREVLLLDADCYPCLPPERYFADPLYRDRGAALWPDHSHTANWTRWDFFGVDEPDPPPPPIEPGQVLVDRARCHEALSLALWYDQHGDWCWQPHPGRPPGGDHGDKGPWRVAFARTQQPFAQYAPEPALVGGGMAYLGLGPARQPWFVHRCGDKARWWRHPDKPNNLGDHAIPLLIAWSGYLRELQQLAMARPRLRDCGNPP